MHAGRNDPCPCGSGKKFKKCHGGIQPPAPRDALPIDLPLAGFPGHQCYIVSRPKFADPADPRNLAHPGGARGPYKVVVTLCRPDAPPTSARDHKAAEMMEGDSHLAIAWPAIQLQDGTRPAGMLVEGGFEQFQLQFEAVPNKRGFLGKFSTTLVADNFAHAEEVAFRCLAPLLSAWSLLLHIPLQIFQIDCTESATRAWRISYRDDFVDALPPSEGPAHTVEFQNYASMYREAMVSNSQAYRFLCLFKIFESIYKRRARLAEEAAASGSPPFTRPQERIPEAPAEYLPWLSAIFPSTIKWDEFGLSTIFLPEVLGRKVKAIFESELTKVRHGIAHALTAQSGELTVSVDQALHLKDLDRWLPIATCMSRLLLRNEFPEHWAPVSPR